MKYHLISSDLTYIQNVEDKKKSTLIDTENRLVVARGTGPGIRKMGGGDQKVQTTSHKINMFYRCNVQQGDKS